MSPSNLDAECYSKELNDGVSLTEERVRDYRAKYAIELDFDERRQETLRTLDAKVQTLNGEAQKLRDLDRNAGPIWAASGHRVKNGYAMDWALVELSHRNLTNMVCTESETET